MNALELKNDLIREIYNTSNLSTLIKIKNILEADTEDLELKISPQIKKEIIASQKAVQMGEYIENDKLDKEVLSWLDEK